MCNSKGLLFVLSLCGRQITVFKETGENLTATHKHILSQIRLASEVKTLNERRTIKIIYCVLYNILF